MTCEGAVDGPMEQAWDFAANERQIELQINDEEKMWLTIIKYHSKSNKT